MNGESFFLPRLNFYYLFVYIFHITRHTERRKRDKTANTNIAHYSPLSPTLIYTSHRLSASNKLLLLYISLLLLRDYLPAFY